MGVFQDLKNEPLMQAYCYYAALLILKMLFMSILTGSKRILNGIFINPEDAVWSKRKVTTNEKVERVRRAHLNDLENIPIMLIITLLYFLTGPNKEWAILLLKISTYSRFVHTFVYAIVPLPQPSRAIAWGIPFFATGYMAIKTLLYFA